MSSQADGLGKAVLVMEDDPQVRMLILEVLRDLHYSAIEACNPEQAIAAFSRRQRIDLMVCDVGLPGMEMLTEPFSLGALTYKIREMTTSKADA